MTASVTPIFNPYIGKAANLDIGWKFSANGKVSVYLGKDDDKLALLTDMMNLNPRLVSRDNAEAHNYIAHGELKSQIKKNLVLSEEKKAKKDGYSSLLDKAIKNLPWEKHNNEYSVSIRYLSAPTWQKDLLNALNFKDNSVIRRIDVGDKLSHKGYVADSSYQNHYVANEQLGKLIEQHMIDNNKQDEVKRQEIFRTGEKLQRMIAERKQTGASDNAAKIVNLRQKEKHSIIVR